MQGKGTVHTGEGFSVITQALCAEDGSLPQGLMVQNVYMELCSGSKNVTVMVRNSMAYPQTLREEDLSGEGSCSHMVTRPPLPTSLTEGIRRGPWLLNTQANCEAKAREVVRGVKSVWIGILTTQAGGFCLVSLGQVP